MTRLAWRKWWVAALVLVALGPSIWLIWSGRDFPQLGYLDDGLYWGAAHSLAEGRGYRIESLPGEPYQTKYPPLYPLLLSLAWKWGASEQSRLAIAAALNIVFLAAVVAGGWSVLHGIVSPKLKVALAFFFAVSPAAALVGMALMSDLPFTALTFAALAMAARARSGRAAFAAGVIAGLAYLTKTAALPLAIALPFSFALRRRYWSAVLAAVGMFPALAGWTVWAVANRAADPAFVYYTDYIGYYLKDVRLRDVPAMVSLNTAFLLRAAGSLIVFDVHGSLDRILSLACGVVAILAAISLSAKATANPYTLFCGIYVFMLLLWNFPADERFVLPLLPLLAAGFACEVLRFRAALGGRRMAAAITVVGFAVWGAVTVDTLARQIPQQRSIHRRLARQREEAFAWIAGNIPKTEPLTSYYFPIVHLRTGRHGAGPKLRIAPFYRGEGAGEAHRMIAAADPGYHMITTTDTWFAALPGDEQQRILAELRRPPFRELFRSDSVVIAYRDAR